MAPPPKTSPVPSATADYCCSLSSTGIGVKNQPSMTAAFPLKTSDRRLGSFTKKLPLSKNPLTLVVSPAADVVVVASLSRAEDEPLDISRYLRVALLASFFIPSLRRHQATERSVALLLIHGSETTARRRPWPIVTRRLNGTASNDDDEHTS